VLSLSSLRSDSADFGGTKYSASVGKGGNWTVGAATSSVDAEGNEVTSSGATDMTIAYKDTKGNDQTIVINARVGDNIEELATFINGQNAKEVEASVSEDGKLQIYAANSKVKGGLTISGGLASDLGIGEGVATTVRQTDVTTVAGAQLAISVLDGALTEVDSRRAELGAFQNRMNHSINNLDNINENVSASAARIKDTDFAKEATQLTKSQILQQSSTAILAQAKQNPSAALSLLG